MPKFIPREKLGKKARRALDAEKRATWSFSPVTRKVENKKHYDRKKSARVWKDDFGMSAFFVLPLFRDKALRLQHRHQRLCRPSVIW